MSHADEQWKRAMTAEQQRLDILRLATLIALVGVLVFLGAISIVNRVGFEEPTDGVTWARRGDSLVAVGVAADGPGARAGLLQGDRLARIGGITVQSPAPDLVDEELWARGIGARLEYDVERGSATVSALLAVGGRPVGYRSYLYLCFVGVAFLIAGLFALLREREGSAGRRFFWLALAFYAVLVLSPTAESDSFFRAIFWVDDTARMALPGLFLYFALTFPQPKSTYLRHRTGWLLGAFGPGLLLWLIDATLLIGDTDIPLLKATKTSILQFNSNLGLVYFAAALGAGVLLLAHSYKVTTSPIERKRLKWLVGGSALGVVPFIVIYVPLFLLGITRAALIDLAVLPFLFVPLSFGYAAVCFRLWDVELIL
ncbi:MAG: hypothetical protein ACE5HV_08540, partial [Acidobacteriota bacterium]